MSEHYSLFPFGFWRTMIFRFGCRLWWAAEWIEAAGDACEDFATVRADHRQSIAKHHERIRNGG